MNPDDIMNIGQRAATEQDSIENELIAENKRLRDELRILREVVPQMETERDDLLTEIERLRDEFNELQFFADSCDAKARNLQAALDALEKDDG